MAALAAAVLVRGAGDVIDNSGSLLSWFSPIAWAQQMRAFVALGVDCFMLDCGGFPDLTTLELLVHEVLPQLHRI